MKFLSLYFLPIILVVSGNLSAQTIKGKLLDRETGGPVAFANVYFNASFKGTTSDTEGLFTLDISKFYGQDVVISCVGYESLKIEEYEPDKFYQIYLKTQSTMLDELVVEPDDIPRPQKLEIFLKEFLGDSPQGKSCIINNLDELRLVYFKSTSTLEGFSDKPLRIHNRALGYRITYFLDKFKNRKKRSSYYGNSLFEEDTILTKRGLRKVKRKRKSAYYGSRMHFFRALWNGRLKQEKFVVINRDNNSVLSATDIVENDLEDEKIKCLLPIAPLRVIYRREYTHIYFEDDEKVLFTENGFFDPNHLQWKGAMAQRRIGDLLPYEYRPE